MRKCITKLWIVLYKRRKVIVKKEICMLYVCMLYVCMYVVCMLYSTSTKYTLWNHSLENQLSMMNDECAQITEPICWRDKKSRKKIANSNCIPSVIDKNTGPNHGYAQTLSRFIIAELQGIHFKNIETPKGFDAIWVNFRRIDLIEKAGYSGTLLGIGKQLGSNNVCDWEKSHRHAWSQKCVLSSQNKNWIF